MCRSCYERFGSPWEPSDDVRAVAGHVIDLEDVHPSGCCLHIVTDDFNIETEHVEWCRNEATKRRHPDCAALAEMFLALTQNERASVLAITHGISPEAE